MLEVICGVGVVFVRCGDQKPQVKEIHASYVTVAHVLIATILN